jgi:hypothetical protein
MQSRMSSCRSSANDFDATEHEIPAESSSAFPLLLNDDNQRLILGSSFPSGGGRLVVTVKIAMLHS